MLSKILFLFPILIAFIGYSVVGYSQNPNPSPALDAFIIGEMDLEKIPGMSTLIVKDGEIVWIESYGWADVENSIPVQDTSVFLLASISKVRISPLLPYCLSIGQPRSFHHSA